jgi:hypothetical protein
LLSLTIMDLCDRLRLMFFGNLYQDWSEFVLADLGIFTYEKVEFCADSRGLRSREDVDACLFLHQCQQRFEAGEPLAAIVEQVSALHSTTRGCNGGAARCCSRSVSIANASLSSPWR